MARSLLEDVPEQTFTSETIKRMYRLVQSAVTDPAFQKIIYGIVNGKMRGQWKDYRGELAAILNWFKKNVDYRRDPFGVELLQDVWATLDRGRGDCDDATVWMCAAAQILGCPTRIVTVSTRPDKEPVHVYPEAMVKGAWLGLDATVPGSFVGWRPPHVTDTKVWTRKELGLSGDEDFSNVEGLGMSDNGYGDDGFGTNMRPVSGRLAPGIPDDISHTYAAPNPGTSMVSQRKIWRAPVANNSDWTSDPRPGGGVYGPALPIKGRPTPAELWYLVDRIFVPKVLDPYSAWWGKVPVAKEDLNRMFPGSEGVMANYLKDIASVPASAIAEIESDVRTQLALGEIGLADVGDAVQEGLEDYALGRAPRMKLPPSQRRARTRVKSNRGLHRGLVNRAQERRYLVPAPANRLIKVSGGSINGLGDIFDEAAKLISSGVQTGTVPQASADQLINSAVALVTGQQPVAPTAAPKITAASVAKVGIPLGMIALLGLAALIMGKSGSSRKYKRNPSRRRGSRSRGRGRGRSGGFDMKTAALWGGGAAAAYFLLLRPGAPLMPAALRPVATAPAPATSSTSSLITAGIKAIPTLFNSVLNLFGAGPTAPAPAPTTAGSGFVTDYSQLFPSQPSAPAPADSGFVMNYA